MRKILCFLGFHGESKRVWAIAFGRFDRDKRGYQIRKCELCHREFYRSYVIPVGTDDE